MMSHLLTQSKKIVYTYGTSLLLYRGRDSQGYQHLGLWYILHLSRDNKYQTLIMNHIGP